MKKIFLAAVESDGERYFAFVIPIRAGENVKPILERYANCQIFHLCETRAQADDTVIAWNASFKNNGSYLFDTPIF